MKFINKHTVGMLYQEALDDMVNEPRINTAVRRHNVFGVYKDMKYWVTVQIQRVAKN